ncbi:unnamed protein product, partial [Closterium sp. NIES-53]
SIGTYVDAVPPPGANVVSGMWLYKVLQRFGFQFSSPQPTPLSTSHSLSAPPSDKSVEQSGPYPELVGCLMYLMTCTRPDLAYHLSLLTRYVAPSRHRKVHWDAAKRVLRYLCSTSSCEAQIYAGAMAAQELRWLTYVLADLGEQPRSPPLMFVDNKAMIALCQEHKLEHSTKHIDLRYFLARELQQRGQLHLAYMATRANTADVFTKALPPGDHQRFVTVLGLLAFLFLTGLVTTCVCAGQTCGKLNTQHRCFSCLDDAWRAEFGDDVELRRWAQLLQSGVAIFDLDYDVIISAIYALSFSAEGDCERNVPLDPGMASAALGASESGTLPGTAAPAQALHTFTRCPFLHFPPVSGGSVRLTVRSSPPLIGEYCCPQGCDGHYHHFWGLASVDLHVHAYRASPGHVYFSARVESVHTRYRASSGSYACSGVSVTSGSRLLLVSPPVAPNSSVAPPPGSPLPATPLWHALPSSCLWSTQVSPSSPALACPALPSLRRGAAARRSLLLLVSPDDCSSADSPHGYDLPVLRLHSDRGGEFSSDLLRDFCRGEGILQSFMLPDSPQQNGISERRIGLVMEYAAHQLNLWPCVSLPETLPTLRWTGEVGDVSVFRVWGSPAFVRDTSADKLSARAIPFVFLGFVPEAPGWQFYHPTSRRVLPSLDVTFEESVPLYHLFPYRSAPPPSLPLSLALGPPPVDPLLPQGPTPSCVSQVDPLPGTAHVEVAVGSGSARGATSGGVASGGAQPGGVESEGAKTGGV